MLRYLKYVAIAVLAIIALTLIAGIIVSLTFDPNEYKDRIARLVEERTGRQLIIGDDLELTVFPWLGVTTGNVSMSNAAGFGDAAGRRLTTPGGPSFETPASRALRACESL